MASISKTHTPTLASITKTRRTRADNLPISVAQSIDEPPERRDQSDGADQTNRPPNAFDETLVETVLSDIRPMIDHPNRTKDVVEALETEEPDQEDRSLQANEAYQTLRQPDEEKIPVGIV